MSKKEKPVALIAAIAASLEGTGEMTSKGNVYNDNLPEGVTPDHVEKIADYTTTFVAAGLEACGDAAMKALKKDKKLENVTSTIGLGDMGSVAYQIGRSREGVPPGGGEKTTYYGPSRTIVKFQPGENNSQLNAAKAGIKAAALEAFGK